MITTLVSYLSHSQIWALQEGAWLHVGGTTNRATLSFTNEMEDMLNNVPELQQAAAGNGSTQGNGSGQGQSSNGSVQGNGAGQTQTGNGSMQGNGTARTQKGSGNGAESTSAEVERAEAGNSSQ